jgi:uncharacterized protein (UPF0332 family)
MQDLFWVAKTLARPQRRARQVTRRRCVSTIYYAFFHALCAVAADELVGAKRRGDAAWVRVYRAVEHRGARRALKDLTDDEESIKDLSGLFANLQDRRNQADYYPAPFDMSKGELIDLLYSVEKAIAALDSLDRGIRLDLASRLAVPDRRRT